jgi:hypothetical protein
LQTEGSTQKALHDDPPPFWSLSVYSRVNAPAPRCSSNTDLGSLRRPALAGFGSKFVEPCDGYINGACTVAVNVT